MTLIKTWTQGQVTLDFNQRVYEEIQTSYDSFSEFLENLMIFKSNLEKNRKSYNINPYKNFIQKCIYILGKDDKELGVFPNPALALKCSQGQTWAEDLRKQFHRIIRLNQEFATKLSYEERELLQTCPVYLHFQTRQSSSFFKQVLFMQRVSSGVTLGSTKTGFNAEFRQVFKIPSLEEIQRKPQFALHRYLDKDKHRQLLKIQTVYLFRHLFDKGIRIWSLNQKNILLDYHPITKQTKYIIIDPTEDFFPPISPLYNLLTHKLCT